MYKIVKDGEVYYSYNKAKKGHKADSSPKRNLKKGQIEVAGIHSHSAWDEKLVDKESGIDMNENFSGQDIGNSSVNNIPEYLVTPEGTLKYYDQNISDQSPLPYNEQPPLYTDLPSDPNDPKNRKKRQQYNG
ncbi:MAG: DUF4329 domain-containing protein [Saprospiraceae bacterium]|nr:DUF4329 domain-containing protein [Saprospiraceae bacterium]